MKLETLAVAGAVGLVGYAIYSSNTQNNEQKQLSMASGMSVTKPLFFGIPQIMEKVKTVAIPTPSHWDTYPIPKPQIPQIPDFNKLFQNMFSGIQKQLKDIQDTITIDTHENIIRNIGLRQQKNDKFGGGVLSFLHDLAKGFLKFNQELLLTPYRAGQTIGRETQIGAKLRGVSDIISDTIYNSVILPTKQHSNKQKEIVTSYPQSHPTATTTTPTHKTERKKYLASAPEFQEVYKPKHEIPIKKTRKKIRNIFEKYPNGISVASPLDIPSGYSGISTPQGIIAVPYR